MEPKKKFGTFAKGARLEKGLGLNQAARLMGISGAYLSRVENGLDSPSGQLMHRMSGTYDVPISELTAHAPKQRASSAAHVHAMQAIPDLRALYRLVATGDSEKIEKFLRKILREKGTPEEDIEKELAHLRSEFPRIRNSGRDGLFASEVRPRFLSATRIALMANEVLQRNNITEATYVPPTPVELIVEREPGVLYRIDELKCDSHGNPIVLGVTGWGERGERQVVINGVLADSPSTADQHRFNFTLAHELFHAVEHLPRIPKDAASPMARMQLFVDAEHVTGRSAAERAVGRWASAAHPRHLTTNEDWREWQANTFASALLMPEWAVRAEFEARLDCQKVPAAHSETLRETALEIAAEHVFGNDIYEQSLTEVFAVSRQAMAIRLLQLGLVQEADG